MMLAISAFGTLLYFGYFQKTKEENTHAPRVVVLESVRQAVEDLIIQNVGRDYFLSNYTPHQSQDYVSQDKTEYILQYDYLVGRSIGIEKPASVSVSYYPVKNFGRLHGIFNCIKQPELCEFTVTRAEALSIADANGINTGPVENKPATVFLSQFAPDRSIFDSDGWYMVVTRPLKSQDGCFHSNTVTIRERDGKVFTELNKDEGCP